LREFDAIVVGGGPAGSSAARAMVRAGLHVAVLDRARFPRVKLCAGWVSAPIWDVLELAPRDYPLSLWEWNRCHVHHRGRTRTFRARGYFIRRYELDAFLLERSGAEVISHAVKRIDWLDGEWNIDDEFRARYLVGAGGTHCPVARALEPPRPARPVGVQELEFQAPPAAIAAARLGEDGEPELILHDDLRGYSWNVPKTDWLNVGCGTVEARDVKDAWRSARDFLFERGHLPAAAATPLERAKGHSYYLFHPEHLAGCERDRALLAGDAVGLAHPLTAEGILPAVVSGRLAGETIASGTPSAYRRRLEGHPLLEDYRTIHRMREAGASLKRRAGTTRLPVPVPATLPIPAAARRVASWAVARGFAWMFTGAPLPIWLRGR
jgi:menaquinone-9 beta-reductase